MDNLNINEKVVEHCQINQKVYVLKYINEKRMGYFNYEIAHP